MADFDVFNISSERDPDDGGVLIVFDGELYGVAATYQLKIESAEVGKVPADVLAFNTDRLADQIPKIERHNDIEVGPDRMTARWKIVTDQGHDVTFRLTLPLLEEFARYLEGAMVRPASH